MFKKLFAVLLLTVLLPQAAAALPVQPDQSIVLPLPADELRFWDVQGAQAWNDKDQALFPEAQNVLTVIAVEMASNDCFILQCGGETAMIDCGLLGYENLVPRILDQLGIERFDYIINTHPHDDHIDGIFELLPRYEIGMIYVGFDRQYRNLNKRLFRDAEAIGIPVEQAEAPMVLPLGAAELQLYQVPWGDNTNNRSLITRVSLDDRSLLLTADIGQSGMLWLLHEYGTESFQADILKAPHHGIDLMPPQLLQAADPQAVFVTFYPHERNAVTHMQLQKLGYEPIYAGLGSLVMKTDGQTWTITQLPGESR